MVDSFLRQGIPEVAKQLTKKSTKAVTWDTAVKQLSHQTQQTLNVSKITNKGDLLPDQVKVMEDLVQTNPEDGVRLLREYEDGLEMSGSFFKTRKEAETHVKDVCDGHVCPILNSNKG